MKRNPLSDLVTVATAIIGVSILAVLFHRPSVYTWKSPRSPKKRDVYEWFLPEDDEGADTAAVIERATDTFAQAIKAAISPIASHND